MTSFSLFLLIVYIDALFAGKSMEYRIFNRDMFFKFINLDIQNVRLNCQTIIKQIKIQLKQTLYITNNIDPNVKYDIDKIRPKSVTIDHAYLSIGHIFRSGIYICRSV